MMAFDPGRDVDEMGEGGGMAFGKAIGAEALDLLEAAFCKIALIAAPHHAFDHLRLETMDRTDMAEGRHCASQSVRLFRCEVGSNDGKAHRLLLEKGNAQRFSKHVSQLVGRIAWAGR